MFDRMREDGLVTGPPYELTELGIEVLSEAEKAR
jgi:hypothetical protein